MFMRGRKIVNIINIIITTLLYAVLISVMAVVVSMRVSGEDVSLFGYKMKTVLSGSMEPGIQTGSIIAIKEPEPNYTFEKNDVITFITDEEKLITHRIDKVRNDNKSYVTKGDANDAVDLEPVRRENIIGVYTGFTIPYLGYVSTFVNSKEGLALLLILPGIGLIFYSVFLISKTFTKLDTTNNNTSYHSKK
ncbi:MAG TPA: signal peptidase I [Candidatus Dormibacteraeota bacterium]|nr:signal peptidase I [Candidatus Dormibacteraeota bacterium]